MVYINPVIRFLLYTNLWIAVGAVAMTEHTRWLLLEDAPAWEKVHTFVFFGTLGLYAAHRLIGMHRYPLYRTNERYRQLYRWRGWLLAACVVSLPFLLHSFLALPSRWRWIVLPFVALSAAYILPVFGQSRRLRDVPLLKVFLLALMWGAFTALLPAGLLGRPWPQLLLLTAERTAYIFAIGLPFDIRDLPFDRQFGVPTLPTRLGVDRTKNLAYRALGLSGVLSGTLAMLGWYPWLLWIGWVSSLGMAAFVIRSAQPDRTDLYFTGAVNGMLVLPFVITYLLSLGFGV